MKYSKLDYSTEDYKSLKISELKRVAEYWYRQNLLFITHTNIKGEYFCPLIKKWLPEDKMQVAHFRDRNHNDTVFELDNTHLISEMSNVWHAKIPMKGYKSKHHYEYEMWLREKIGNKKVEDYLYRPRNLSIFVRELYIDTIKKYRNVR